MRVDITPRLVEAQPGQPTPLTITITNDTGVIGGYVLRVLGADPTWVDLELDEFSLFPEETRAIALVLTLPAATPAGTRRVAIQARELAPPFGCAVSEVDLRVAESESVRARLDPMSVTGGRRAVLSMIVTNDGNTTVRRAPAADDPEGVVTLRSTPSILELAPGQQTVVELGVRARRPLLGSPAVRVLSLYLDPHPELGDAPRHRQPDRPTARDERTAVATGTFVQRPWLTRGSLSLVGLLAAATVFAVVISSALAQLAAQSSADRSLALQIAEGNRSDVLTTPAEITGTVTSLTSTEPIPAITVNAFAAADTAVPVVSTSTDKSGNFTLANLPADSYKINFQGSGLRSTWYRGPSMTGAETAADALVLDLTTVPKPDPLAVQLGGEAATISGSVVGEDVATATLSLQTDDGSATFRTVPVGADGLFALTDVPSPLTYRLVVSKAGYEPAKVDVDVGAGETRTGVKILLSRGGGTIKGKVNDLDGTLPENVTITATSDQGTVTTRSVSGGGFTLTQLPTPATYTVVATAPDRIAQVLILTLSAKATLNDVTITLSPSVGSLEGFVSARLNGATAPAPGVSVTATDGTTTVRTVTESEEASGSAGRWSLGRLPAPGRYTLTFSRSDLQTQTVGVELDASGRAVRPVRSLVMGSATATLHGTVTRKSPTSRALAAVVTLTSGSTTYTTRATTQGNDPRGSYRLEGIEPGTYTLGVISDSGTSVYADTVELAAGDNPPKTISLGSRASIAGTIRTRSDHQPVDSWEVTLYREADYPQKAASTTQTSSKGRYEFDDLDAGVYIISVRRSPLESSLGTREITVEPGKPASGDLEVDGE